MAEIRGRDARVRLRNLTTGAGPVPGSSLTRVAALGALAGHEIEVVATGSDAGEVVRRVTDLAERGFDEVAAPRSNGPQEARGVSARAGSRTGAAPAGGIDGGAAEFVGSGPFPASAGIAIGPIWRPGAVEFDLPTVASGPPEDERERLDAALARVSDRITTAIEQADDGSGAGFADYTRSASANPQADIFRAHLLLLEDEEVIRAVHDHIGEGAPAERAWATVLDDAAAELADLPDDYQRARAADIRAVRDQVVAALLGIDSEIDSRPGILVAADLTPGQVSALDPEVVTGIALAQGSPTAHSVILAHAKGIPAIVGAGSHVLTVPEGTTVALDGGTGQLVITPDERTRIEFTTRAKQQRDRLHAAQAAARQPARTRDDITVHVAANVGSVSDATDAVQGGADLAGLIRTEFLFLNRDHAPSVDEQEQIYRSIARTFDGRRIVLRTLDVGGDKPLPYIPQPSEANPFLGLRGIRLTLAHPDLLHDQLRAIVRVAAEHPVSVMFPMVSQLAELRTARTLLDSVVKSEGLVREDISLKVGIMVEIPATAAKTPVFARHVDFLSIGTNDLTQYALAAERGNAAVAAAADALDPGVLQLIDWVCRGSAATPVAVCGEIAADPAAIPVLLGLGVTELSVAPPAVALTKATIRDLNLPECVELARRALRSESAAEVRNQR
ncbi:phosphoenolpyruvate--protein phosphotransferase [Nocardia alni]|uniref:phosphoenolpyruvate--protein phosphotransferase n=1 Tax=Nocardia alni TaxID=2815723 RepID=UPI0027E0F17D|nr:phosphoenolpyruvate--protein phosphotransferase [Nocardia alni]